MKIRITRLPEKSKQEDSALFTIRHLVPSIRKAIEILNANDCYVLAKEMNTEKNIKIELYNVAYVEYLERDLFLYTTSGTYFIRQSLISFLESSPNYFVQISKNTLVNQYQILSFLGQNNGNLMLTLKSGENLIVSRRYVKSLKNALQNAI